MPELPEVEVVRRGLVTHVVGRRITRVDVGRERTVRRTSRQAVIDGWSVARPESAGAEVVADLTPPGTKLDASTLLNGHPQMVGEVEARHDLFASRAVFSQP
jgi:formamidopyrimidine-DNA glycosylase